MKCDNCREKIKVSSFKLIDNLLKDIFLQESCIENDLILSMDLNIWRFIFEYITNMDGHSLIHTCKSRSKPDHMEYDSDDEISGYYWKETKNICTVCYQHGIKRSLDNQKRLPYLRYDIYYFLNHCDSDSDSDSNKITKNYLKDIYNIQLQYFLPKIYVLDYYRQSVPDKISENHYLIKSN